MTVDEDFKVKCEAMRNIAEVRVKFAEFLKENNLRICCSSKYDKKGCSSKYDRYEKSEGVKKNYIEVYYDFYEDGDSLLVYSTEFNEEGDKLEYEDLVNV